MHRDIEAFNKLAKFGRELLHRPSPEEGLPMIASYAVELLHSDRCSVFVYNKKKNKLWTKISDGVDRIEIDADKGLAGYALKSREAIVVNNPYEDKRFFQKVDEETGYITKNILSIAVFDAFRRPIGVLQFLNKKNDEEYNQDDVELATFFNHYISTYLELATLLEESE